MPLIEEIVTEPVVQTAPGDTLEKTVVIEVVDDSTQNKEGTVFNCIMFQFMSTKSTTFVYQTLYLHSCLLLIMLKLKMSVLFYFKILR